MNAPISLEILEALRGLDSCAVANAIESFDVRLRNEGFTDGRVQCQFPRLGPMVGHAVTARIRCSAPPPDGHPYIDRTDWWNHILTTPEPRVVAIQDVDHHAGLGGFIGEVHAHILRALGCVGAVTDGSVRDLQAAEAMGFHLFARHAAVSHAYVHMVDFGLPVKLGGLWVKPGDLIHADQHGAVTIPAEIAPRIPEAVVKVEADERKIISLCKSPTFSADGLKQLYKQIRPGTY